LEKTNFKMNFYTGLDIIELRKDGAVQPFGRHSMKLRIRLLPWVVFLYFVYYPTVYKLQMELFYGLTLFRANVHLSSIFKILDI